MYLLLTNQKVILHHQWSIVLSIYLHIIYDNYCNGKEEDQLANITSLDANTNKISGLCVREGRSQFRSYEILPISHQTFDLNIKISKVSIPNIDKYCVKVWYRIVVRKLFGNKHTNADAHNNLSVGGVNKFEVTSLNFNHCSGSSKNSTI